MSNKIQLRDLTIRHEYPYEGTYEAAVSFQIGGDELKIKLTTEDTLRIVEACGVAITEASNRAVIGMNESIKSSLVLEAPKKEEALSEEEINQAEAENNGLGGDGLPF